MELELLKESIDCYEAADDFQAAQDESLETIVPDHSPDIARIVTAEGMVFLRSAEARDGKTELSGTVRVTVLYVPEGGGLLRPIEAAIPFVMLGECPRDCICLRASVRAENLAARTINPRKIQTQCRLTARVTAYRRTAAGYTAGYTAENRLCIQSLLRREETTVVVALPEKEFTFEDTAQLPQNREGAAELLSSRLRGCVTECRSVGKKAVAKGNFALELLLRTNGGRCETASFDLPFSQIVEAEQLPEGASVQGALQLMGMDCRPDEASEDGRGITLRVSARLLLTVSERRELTLLTDLYSTAFETETILEQLQLSGVPETQSRRQIWQDTLEVGVAPESILSVSASVGAGAAGSTEGGILLSAPLQLRILYLDAEGKAFTAERTAEVSLPFPGAWTESLCCRAACGDEVTATITSGGIAARVPVDFELETPSGQRMSYISSVKISTEQPRETADAPSLILRRREAGETLWAIAKRYGTTGADILAANGCAAEQELPEQRLLLIPKKRT